MKVFSTSSSDTTLKSRLETDLINSSFSLPSSFTAFPTILLPTLTELYARNDKALFTSLPIAIAQLLFK